MHPSVALDRSALLNLLWGGLFSLGEGLGANPGDVCDFSMRCYIYLGSKTHLTRTFDNPGMASHEVEKKRQSRLATEAPEWAEWSDDKLLYAG